MQIKIHKKRSKKIVSKNNNCYFAKNLKEISDILQLLKTQNAKFCKLFFANKNYYILSEKSLNLKNKFTSDYILGYLQEYTILICENAIKEILKLL